MYLYLYLRYILKVSSPTLFRYMYSNAQNFVVEGAARELGYRRTLSCASHKLEENKFQNVNLNQSQLQCGINRVISHVHRGSGSCSRATCGRQQEGRPASSEFDSSWLDELEEDKVASPIYWGEVGATTSQTSSTSTTSRRRKTRSALNEWRAPLALVGNSIFLNVDRLYQG